MSASKRQMLPKELADLKAKMPHKWPQNVPWFACWGNGAALCLPSPRATEQPQCSNWRVFVSQVSQATEGSPKRCLGFGAPPQDKRREGYPSGQATSRARVHSLLTTAQHPASGATSRVGSLRANDAASRPDHKTTQSALFLPGAEKSSIKSTS